MKDSHKIGTALSFKLVITMNKSFLKSRKKKVTSTLYFIEKYVSNGIEESVEKVSARLFWLILFQ